MVKYFMPQKPVNATRVKVKLIKSLLRQLKPNSQTNILLQVWQLQNFASQCISAGTWDTLLSHNNLVSELLRLELIAKVNDNPLIKKGTGRSIICTNYKLTDKGIQLLANYLQANPRAVKFYKPGLKTL